MSSFGEPIFLIMVQPKIFEHCCFCAPLRCTRESLPVQIPEEQKTYGHAFITAALVGKYGMKNGTLNPTRQTTEEASALLLHKLVGALGGIVAIVHTRKAFSVCERTIPNVFHRFIQNHFAYFASVVV